MHARDLLEIALPYLACLCFPCSAFLKTAKVSELLLKALGDTTGWGETPSAEGCGHRHWIHPSAINRLPVGTKYCRPALNVCRTCNSQQQRAKTCMAMQFKQFVHQSCPLSYLWLKGTRASILGPPITHFHAWWPKEPSMQLLCQMHTNQTNKTRPNSYHQVKEQGMHARCNAT